MDNGFKECVTREEINCLPIRGYDGHVRIVCSDAAAQAAVEKLKKERVLGFDTETKASFTRGVHHRPSLVQIAATDVVYIFRLHDVAGLGGLGPVFADPGILKVGVGMLYDVRQLKEMQAFEEAGFVELEKLTDLAGIKNNSLRALTAIVLGFRMSKKEKKSDWSRLRLTESQIRYAATDAWASREIFLKLEALGRTPPDPSVCRLPPVVLEDKKKRRPRPLPRQPGQS
ncbi:MAG: 3'-5' exonuclease domain-containing protein 2 [Deltaproteobacteria bacterium]|nr:3'-5' exonuclease domain-containing protein 2 [Deltaproteobacteria bacterium]